MIYCIYSDTYIQDFVVKGVYEMNGYGMLAESYRTLVKQGKLTEEDAQKDIDIFEFFSKCDEKDFCRMVDTSAFNQIIKAYCAKALQEADVDEKMADRVMDELRYIMDTHTAREVIEND